MLKLEQKLNSDDKCMMSKCLLSFEWLITRLIGLCFIRELVWEESMPLYRAWTRTSWFQ